VSANDWLAEQFEDYRTHLKAVAYRMLGSMTDADDALQEAWLRLSRSDAGRVENMGAWLTTVVGRICLDMLRARRARREEYAGSWLPEPVVQIETGTDPEQEALMADSVGLALLVVLETLTPAERLAFVLHDMFAVPFEEIAEILGKTPVAARQLASRGRRRVRGAAPSPDPDRELQRRVVDAFLAAARAGDFEALVAVLDPNVVFRADSREPVVGAEAVAQRVLRRGTPLAHLARPAVVNGAAGVVVVSRGKPLAVVGFTIVGGRIAEIDLVLDRKKLEGLEV
jgi:RNA polymerase sigma factor (sigma-70 family)